MTTSYLTARGTRVLSASLFCGSLLCLLAAGCNDKPTPSSIAPEAPKQAAEAPRAEVPTTTAPMPSAQPAPVAVSPAKVGEMAPELTLPGIDGKPVTLKEQRGKVVVLEWFNPGCPFVQRSHTKGSLVDTAARHTKAGVVWLAINSGAEGKQGHGVDANRAGAERFGLSHPVLLDETGTVGRAYGATNTPHLFIVDAKGVLVYRGAIDNSPDGEGQSAEGGKLINYVDQALGELAKGKAVSVPETKAYGCSVKYGS